MVHDQRDFLKMYPHPGKMLGVSPAWELGKAWGYAVLLGSKAMPLVAYFNSPVVARTRLWGRVNIAGSGENPTAKKIQPQPRRIPPAASRNRHQVPPFPQRARRKIRRTRPPPGRGKEWSAKAAHSSRRTTEIYAKLRPNQAPQT